MRHENKINIKYKIAWHDDGSNPYMMLLLIVIIKVMMITAKDSDDNDEFYKGLHEFTSYVYNETVWAYRNALT